MCMLDFAKWTIEKIVTHGEPVRQWNNGDKIKWRTWFIPSKTKKHLFNGIPKYVINLLTWKFVPGAKIDRFLRG